MVEGNEVDPPPPQHSFETDIVGETEEDTSALVLNGNDSEIKTVLILVAMEAEALPMVEHLKLKKNDPPVIPPPAPCVSFSGSDWGMDIHLVCFGKCPGTGMDTVGTAPASLFSYLAIQAFSPDIVVSAGTAGGFKARGAHIGDVFVATATVNHDRRIPIPGFDVYGIDKRRTLTGKKLKEALGLKGGVCSSGNSLDYTSEDMKLMTEHCASVKEMEAAAIAWSASLFDIPLLCLKSITDIVDGDKPPQEEFLENLHKAAESLQRVVPKALEFMSGKRLSDLL